MSYMYIITHWICNDVSPLHLLHYLTWWYRYRNFAPTFKGRYLSSNANITFVDQNGQVINTPVGCKRAFCCLNLPCSYLLYSPLCKVQDPKVSHIQMCKNQHLNLFLRGRRVTAFGVLYDFKGNDKNTTVQVVGNMVKESWVRLQIRQRWSSWMFWIQFLSAIQEEPDFFLLVG